MRPVFLIGYMGSGKSTLGRTVARLTGMDVIDLDQYIEGRFHQSVSDLFAQRGEDGFRKIESAMLAEVAEFEDVIIACGGGTPCFGNNMDLMNSRGTTVWLNTNLTELHTRLCRGRHKRPLIAGMNDQELLEYIEQSTAKRYPYYSRAQIEFVSTLLDTRSEAEATALRFIKMLNLPLLSPQ